MPIAGNEGGAIAEAEPVLGLGDLQLPGGRGEQELEHLRLLRDRLP